MLRFGTDKPDLRFSMELVEISTLAQKSSFEVFREQLNAGGIVKGLLVKGGADMSRKTIEEYTAFVHQFGVQGLAWMKMQEGSLNSSIVKFFDETLQRDLVARFQTEDGDLIFMVADTSAKVNQSLDHLRRKIAKDRHLIPEDTYALLWVTDFPLSFGTQRKTARTACTILSHRLILKIWHCLTKSRSKYDPRAMIW